MAALAAAPLGGGRQFRRSFSPIATASRPHPLPACQDELSITTLRLIVCAGLLERVQTCFGNGFSIVVLHAVQCLCTVLGDLSLPLLYICFHLFSPASWTASKHLNDDNRDFARSGSPTQRSSSVCVPIQECDSRVAARAWKTINGRQRVPWQSKIQTSHRLLCPSIILDSGIRVPPTQSPYARRRLQTSCQSQELEGGSELRKLRSICEVMWRCPSSRSPSDDDNVLGPTSSGCREVTYSKGMGAQGTGPTKFVWHSHTTLVYSTPNVTLRRHHHECLPTPMLHPR